MLFKGSINIELEYVRRHLILFILIALVFYLTFPFLPLVPFPQTI